MANTKFIQILVDPETHKKYRGLLKRRGKGERVKYLVGNNAVSYMERTLKKEAKNNGEG